MIKELSKDMRFILYQKCYVQKWQYLSNTKYQLRWTGANTPFTKQSRIKERDNGHDTSHQSGDHLKFFCLFPLQLNLIVSGTSENLTVMLEGEANNLDKHLFLEGIRCGLESCAQIAKQIKKGKLILD